MAKHWVTASKLLASAVLLGASGFAIMNAVNNQDFFSIAMAVFVFFGTGALVDAIWRW